MGILGKILNRIFGRDDEGGGAKPAGTAAPEAPTPAAPQAMQSEKVDVEAVLTAMEKDKGVDLNWRTSIVDLLKLLDLDSSLSARKELAEELGVHAGEHGSAEQNIALHEAVVKKLEENGGKVPADMKA